MPNRSSARMLIEKALRNGETLDCRTAKAKYGVSGDMLRRTVVSMKGEGYNIITTKGPFNRFTHRMAGPGETVPVTSRSKNVPPVAFDIDQIGQMAQLLGKHLQVSSVVLGVTGTSLVLEDPNGDVWKMSVVGMVPAPPTIPKTPRAAVVAPEPVAPTPEPEPAPELQPTPEPAPVPQPPTPSQFGWDNGVREAISGVSI